jgi:hypothetical protein
VPAKPEPSTADVPGASALVGVVLLLVGFGVLAAAPGLVLVAAVLILPSWLLGTFLSRRLRTRQPSTATAAGIARAGVVVFLVPFLVGLAVFIALGMLCYMSASREGFH